jgi:hypothetical protein
VFAQTLKGDYGHGLDAVWLEIGGVEVVGVADADAGGLGRAAARWWGDRGVAGDRRVLGEVLAEWVWVCGRRGGRRGGGARAVGGAAGPPPRRPPPTPPPPARACLV